MTPLTPGNNILSIKEFYTEAVLGVYDWERQAARPVLINLDIAVQTAKAAQSDDVNDALDYAVLLEKLDQMVRASHFKLIETLAECIAEFILNNFSSQHVKVEVIKPNVFENVGQISICIERQK